MITIMPNSVIETTYVCETPKFEKIKMIFHNITKFLSNLLFIVVVALMLIILFYNFYTKKYGTNGQTPIISAYVIVTPSMVPTINVADAVVTYKTDVKNLQKGDIITFSSTDARYTGLTVTHRILKVNTDNGVISFKTKGDNNTTPDDAEVVGTNIFGKVIFVIPWLGYLQQFLTRSYGWLLLVVLPCIGIIVYDILKLSKTIKNSKVTKDVKFKDVEILDIDEGTETVDTTNTNIGTEQVTEEEILDDENNSDIEIL